MPDTRPGIVFDKDGVCSACRHYENRKNTDWKARWKELEILCDKYRRYDGSNDCIIAVSSGKDSHYQTYIMKEKLNMNPLLVSANTLFSWTDEGRKNFNNIIEAFGCDIITLSLNPKMARMMTRTIVEDTLHVAYPMDLAIYVFPLRVAINYNIPLIVYGENISYEYGGFQEKETYSAKEQIYNDVAKPLDFEFWKKRGVEKKDLNQLIYPTTEEINKAKLEPIYLSYFTQWDSYKNYLNAKEHGFTELKHWNRKGHLDNFTQIDTIGYLIDCWFKFLKFGEGQVTDIASRMIRYGYLTRDEAIKLVNEKDWQLDEKVLDDYLDFTGYSKKEFFSIVNKFINKNIIEKKHDTWRLKNPCR